LKIYFLNSIGFQTGYFYDNWTFSFIDVGETRIEKGYVDFYYGQPTYFRVTLSY